LKILLNTDNHIDGTDALEARLQNDDPIGASHDDEDMEKTIRGACDKLKTLLDSRIEKQRGY